MQITIIPEIKGCYGVKVIFNEKEILDDENKFSEYKELQKRLTALAIFPAPFKFEFPFGIKQETLKNIIEVFSRTEIEWIS